MITMINENHCKAIVIMPCETRIIVFTNEKRSNCLQICKESLPQLRLMKLAVRSLFSSITKESQNQVNKQENRGVIPLLLRTSVFFSFSIASSPLVCALCVWTPLSMFMLQ